MSSKNSVNLISSKELSSLSIKVTEKIEDKNIFNFLRTNIKNSEFSISSKTKFYYSFIPSSLSYEILIFNCETVPSIPEPFIFEAESTIDNIDLFITEQYFCLFDSKKLLFYKKIENILQEDIQIYIEQLYKIKIDKTIQISEEKLKSLQDNYLKKLKKVKLKFYPVQKDNSYYFFGLFLVISIVILIGALYTQIQKKTTSTSTTTQIVQNKYDNLLRIYETNNKKPVDTIIDLFEEIKLQKIVVEKVSYKNDKLEMVLVHKNRQQLLDMVTMYKKKIQIISIVLNKNSYKMDISIVL